MWPRPGMLLLHTGCGGVGGDVKVQYKERVGEGRKERGRGEVFFCPFIFLATANTERKLFGGDKLCLRPSPWIRPSEDDFPHILQF